MKKFDHIAIQVTDIMSSVEWYKTHTGASIEYLDDTWAMLKTCNVKVALILADQHPPHWAIAVDSLDEMPAGSKISLHRDGSRFVYLTDPDGNTIEYVLY